MRQVPFKCKFGHVSVIEFKNNENIPNEIECNRCKIELTSKVVKYEHPYNDKDYIHSWPSKKLIKRYIPEMAVRF